ncbi:MAG: efflux RND transporter permease subunit [Candidatus Kapabacteria bacterium]|nr:efflux RND transporter permease subunit [Ignavibacteriota bacterium]MCW5883347.1 efflux RND transporter permease subunit [Candidatus Kapabacteria bacterium]
MILAKISIERPIMTTMVILVFLIFGYISFTSLNMNQVPEVNIPFVTIQTVYPGAGPKEIETQISKKIEDAVATVSQIKRLESYSLDGVSLVMIEFDLKKNIDIANQEVKDKVEEIINYLPNDADRPIIQKVDLQSFPIIDIVFSGNLSPKELYDVANRTLKDRFSQIAGVARVNLIGGEEREIKITFDDRTVFENIISLPQMLGILGAQNFDIPGGYFNIEGTEYTVRMKGEFQDLDEIGEMEVPTAFGKKKLNQIASIDDASKTVRQRAVYFDNKTKLRDENVVRLSIIKASDGNAINISNDLKKIMPELKEIIPNGTKLTIVNDDSSFTKSNVDDTMGNIYLGILFTSIILLLFLHDLRSTLIVALSMPTSIISTFLLVKASGFSLNMMSLMGISVSVGVLVSNSIVVIENIFRYKDLGKSRKEAAYLGTKEVVVAVFAATLTNVVVFVPLANISSMVGEFLKELALTATYATIFSLLMSFTLTPMLASLLIPEKPKIGRLSKILMRFENLQKSLYEKVLRFFLKNKYIPIFSLVGVAVIFYVVVIAVYGPNLAVEFMPQGDNGKIRIQVKLPEGDDLTSTTQLMRQIEQRVSKYDDVENILTNIGKSTDLDIGANLSLMEVYLNEAKYRETSVQDYVTMFIRDLADIPNADIKVGVAENMAGPGAPIEFFLLGQDLNKLESIKDEIMDKIKNVEGLVNLDNSSSAGKPEITITPKREKMAEVGITVNEIALTLRAAIEGIVSTQFKELGEEYDISVTLNEESTNTPEKIANIPIATPMGSFRLSQLCEVEFTKGFTMVLRRDKYIAIKFTADAAPGVPTGNIINEITKIIDGENVGGEMQGGIDMPVGYRIKWAGTSEMQMEMAMDLGFAFMLAFLLTYMLLAAMLESFWQPVLILITLPLALIGVILLMYYTDTNFGLTAMMGMIMLLGIVVNNAILLLDYTNQLVRDEKLSAKDALIKAGPTKIKPILMSTTAIILGMLPMALGMGETGSEMRIPLGIVSIGGLLMSTVLTLIIVPSAYYVNDGVFRFFGRLFRRKPKSV